MTSGAPGPNQPPNQPLNETLNQTLNQGFSQPAADRTGAAAPTWSVAPNPTARPKLRRTIQLGIIVVGFALAGAILLNILEARIAIQVIVLTAAMSLVPLCIVVPTYLWLDRFEAEPIRYQFFAFGWGALVAVVAAFWFNTASMEYLLGQDWTANEATTFAATYIAPFSEETLKGAGIVMIFLARRKEFDGIIDGVVYAGLIGAGFAFSENILYLSRVFEEPGLLGAVFVIRCLMGPFAHPLFTSFIGVGLGIAVSTRNPAVRVVAVLLGWACAMLLHGIWNASASAGEHGFIEGYIAYQVPLFIGFIAFLFFLRRREGKLVGQYLSPYADAGWLTHGEVVMLSNLQHRRVARAWAQQHGGAVAKRSMNAFQDSATDLAFLRSRMVHQSAEKDASERERVLLESITVHRQAFIGSGVV